MTTDLTAVPTVTEHPWTLEVLGAPAIQMVAYGDPAPQGSKNARAIYKGKGEARQFTGKVAVHESSKKVKPWRGAVTSIAKKAVARIDGYELLDGPLIADFVFTMPKGTTLPKWKAWHDTSPDLSKLARSTEDALNKVLWVDDARVCAYRRLEAVYVGSDDQDALVAPGVVIRVWRVPADLIDARKALARLRRTPAQLTLIPPV